MNQFVQNMTGMGGMTDQVIATDFLIAAKTGIKNYALALSETSNPEVREMLRTHLNKAIDTHQEITDYMVSKGYYHPQNVQEQLKVDLQATDTALHLPQQ